LMRMGRVRSTDMRRPVVLRGLPLSFRVSTRQPPMIPRVHVDFQRGPLAGQVRIA